ncbi:GTPase-activating rap/Ran-GAP domain-like protein 3, partial [Clonorchis sinensis]
HGSEEFNQFIKLLGDRINLKSWDRFKGGLDTKSNTTGIDSVYTVYEGHEIMFHVSTLLPFSTENRQQIERKRHVGNDIVNIIFVDGIEPDAQPSWMPSMMKTHFTHIFAIVTYCKKSSTYRLNVFAEESVPIFGPPLPSPPEFTNPQEFREFLLVKLINGEKAAFHSPVFAQKRERTLEMLLHVICSANMSETSSVGLARRTFSDVVTDSFNGITTGKEQMRHDAHIKFGQMLKLNTIIRGDAPTSCITSGQAKKKPWQPKHFHTPLQYEVNCADVWKLCQPVLFIDRSVEVRQLEVTEQNEMLVIRYDKSREARVSVIPLADRDFGQQLDKTQVRKMSLEKSKGCHLFALNKSIMHPMKLAIVVHKRIFIYQWQIVTGQSLSSWNQIAQSNTPDNFQVIREIPILDPVQTICFLDGIPGGRICVGHRNQFDLIDERNREIMPLFRTESSRNQVVSAHEFWEDDEPELLLCFTRTCHFQKLTQMQTCNSVMRKLQSLSSSGSETTGSSGNSSSTTQRLADHSFSPPTPALFPNASMDSSSAGTPDWTTNSPLPMSSSSSEKCKANEFDFTWNFTPEQVVVSHSYIIAFTSTSIELRLINNGSLVHTLLAPDCRLVAYKNGFYFTSTADNLDNNCGSSGMCEYSTLRKLATCMTTVEYPSSACAGGMAVISPLRISDASSSYAGAVKSTQRSNKSENRVHCFSLWLALVRYGNETLTIRMSSEKGNIAALFFNFQLNNSLAMLQFLLFIRLARRNSKHDDDKAHEEKSESDDLCKTIGGNKQSPVLPNTSTAAAALCAHSPLRTASDGSITKPYFIYRIAFHTDPVSESLQAAKPDKNSSIA